VRIVLYVFGMPERKEAIVVTIALLRTINWCERKDGADRGAGALLLRRDGTTLPQALEQKNQTSI
jgi:hypothetical protein